MRIADGKREQSNDDEDDFFAVFDVPGRKITLCKARWAWDRTLVSEHKNSHRRSELPLLQYSLTRSSPTSMNLYGKAIEDDVIASSL